MTYWRGASMPTTCQLTASRSGLLLPVIVVAAGATGCLGTIGDSSPFGGGDSSSDGVCEAAYQPAPVALKRLNRREYENTVRDLLYLPSVDMSAFPQEAAAEGFDTVPSGLYMTEALVDAYWTTSRSLIARALSGVGGGSATVELDLEPQSPDTCEVVAGWANICSETTLTSDVDLPLSDQYTIAVRAYGVEAGGEAPNMRVTVDGGSPHDFAVTASAEAPEVYELTADLTAGNHRIAIALTNDYYAPPENRDLRVDWFRVTAATGGGTLTDSRERILICSPSESDDETCARLIVTNFVNRAWRRPIQSEDEIAAMLQVFSSAMDAGNDFEASIALALRAVLMSPGFVFRPEFEDANADGLGRRYLDGYELASRLSYAIWSSMPDDELFALAGEGALVDPTVLDAQVERMIASPKAVGLIEGFVPQWLEIGTLAEQDRDASLFPTYQTVRPHMSGESIAFFSSFLFERKDIRELVNADYGYINEALAAHYGISGVTGPEFRRVAYDGDRIGGIWAKPASSRGPPATRVPLQ